jgi:YHS domain-containing protein
MTQLQPKIRHRMNAAAAIAVAFALAVLASAGPAWAAEPPVRTDSHGLAVDGYDPVAYFTDGKPVPGKAEFETEWMGAKWRFASAEHRDAFVAEPEKYAPRYGGYCAYAVAKGHTAKADPEAWKIIDGRLYLNYDQDIRERWLADSAGYIVKADANWPGVLEK